MATTITLGKEEVEIFELPFIPNRHWCEKAMPILTADEAIARQEKMSDGYREYLGQQIDYGQQMFDLVLDFLPDQSKRDHYAALATSSEVLKAFYAVAQVAFSTGFFLGMYGGKWANGLTEPQTGTNSADPSGESGATN